MSTNNKRNKPESDDKGKKRHKPNTENDILNYRFVPNMGNTSARKTRWETTLKAKIDGVPRPYYRSAFATGKKAHCYNPRPGYAQSFKAAATAALDETGIAFNMVDKDLPVKLVVKFFFTRPQKHCKWSTLIKKWVLPNDAPHFVDKVPDVDNLIKLTMDAFTKTFYDDDRTVASITSEKLWFEKAGALYPGPEHKDTGCTIFRVTQFNYNRDPATCPVTTEI